MYKFIILAASAAFASAYTTPTTQCTDFCNPIAKPGLNEVVPAGTEYTITWQPTTEGTVSIVLLKGPSENIIPVYAVAEKIANTGTFTWTPATDLQPTGNSGYGFQLINDADGTYQWSTQFGISNADFTPSVSGSASPSGSAAPTGNGAASSAAASESAAPTGLSSTTTSASAPASESTDATTTTLSTSTRAGPSTTSSGVASQSSNAAAVLGAVNMGGAFAAVLAAVVAL